MDFKIGDVVVEKCTGDKGIVKRITGSGCHIYWTESRDCFGQTLWLANDEILLITRASIDLDGQDITIAGVIYTLSRKAIVE